jgi:hypothetical protein
VPEEYAALIRRVALVYIDKYGDAAVEIIRAECIQAHRNGRWAAFNSWRNVGVAADDILLTRAQSLRAS